MTTFNHGERLAVLEAQAHAHAREHALQNEVLAAKLQTIEARLAGIERALMPRGHEGHGHGNGNGVAHGWRPSRRDVGVTSVAAAVATALWWALEQAGRAAGRG